MELNRNCFMKTINRKKINEPLNSEYDNKILKNFIVYR